MKPSLILINFLLIISTLNAQQTYRTSLGMPNQSHGGQSGVATESGDQIMVITDLTDTKICSISEEGDMNWSISSPNGGSSVEAGRIILLANGNLVAYTFDNENLTTHLVCLNQEGEVIWEKQLALSVGISDITALSNGNLAFVANTINGQVFMSYMSSEGQELWGKQIINPASPALNCSEIRESATSGVLLNYYTWDGSSPCSGWMELSADGEFLWQKLYEIGPDEYRYSGSELGSDGNYYFVGALIPQSGYQFADLLITKLSSQGELLGHKVFADIYTDEAKDIIETSDGGLLLIGSTKPTWPCGGNTFVAKINYELDSIFTKNYGDSSGDLFGFFRELQLQNGDVYAFGSGGLSSGVGNTDAHIIKTNQNFELACSTYSWNLEVYEPALQSESNVAIYTLDFGLAITDSNVFFTSEIQSARICESEPVSIDKLDSSSLLLYPNPVEDFLYIDGFESSSKILIYNSIGELVRSTFYNADGVDVSMLSSGIYSVRVGSDQHQLMRLSVR
ncbi:MAG: T9SS type A sorting domain-containing protein [Flavobacteriales bacterium]